LYLLFSDINVFLSCHASSTKGHKKRTKETYGSPLFTMVAHGPSRARTRKLNWSGLLERERERVYKYLELPNI